MARPKINVDSETIAKAEEELEKIKDSKLSIQLKAIIAAAEHPVENVANVLKVSARSIFRWITKFKEGSVEALRDRPKGHMRSKLTEEYKKEIEQWIVSGKNAKGEAVHWTLKGLRKEVEKEFGIHIGITPLWKHLKKMDLVLKKPRPVHAKAERNAQEAFKKNLA
jgi:transposase